MQENIETKNIGNRKFIIELRFDPKVSMLDKKGLLAEQIENCKAFNINHWEIGQSEVSIRDHEDKEKATNIVAVTFNRLSFISFKINSAFSSILPCCFHRSFNIFKLIYSHSKLNL